MSNPKKIVTVETGLSDSFTAINRDLIVQETKDYTLCPRQKVMKLLPLSMNSPLDIPYSPFLDITRHTSTIEGEYLDKHAEIMDIIHYRLQTHIKTKELFDTHSKLECMFKGECWQTNDLIKRAKGLSKTIDDFMVVLRACIDLCVEMVEEWVVGACLCMHGMILKFRGIMDAQCLKGLIEFKGCLINIGSIKGTDALKDVIELIDKL